jgi:transposase-like protein
VGDLPLLALCLDACKGLKNAMNNVFPYAEKRECFRHLIQNYIKQFGGSEYIIQLLELIGEKSSTTILAASKKSLG